jgi:BirA family transcriptional regulator, biotin operon repressor / biotin---[acetyl-CoA-carboxylase] ligase
MLDDFLDAAAICRSTFVRSAEIHGMLGSTSDRAAELLRDPRAELPALVAARTQTTGRGRGTNTWLAGEGALTLSVILNPRELGLPVEWLPQLSLAVGIAACDALENELGQMANLLAIKWPNDLILNDAKVGGILIETVVGIQPQDCRAIIGIGINVNNRVSKLEPPVVHKLPAISLCEITRRSHDLQTVVCQLMKAIEVRTKQLAIRDPQLLDACRRKNWLHERTVIIETGNSRVTGPCRGIDDDGALLVATETGFVRITSGSVIGVEPIQSNR